jgi:hypothetical protein
MSQTIESRPSAPATPAAPYSRALQLAAGVCLVLAAVTNGLSQYVGELVTGGGDFSEQIRWGAEHVAFHRTEQIVLVVSALFMPLGLLGVANVTRWTARRMTLVAVPLLLWGMWGFHNVLAMGFVSGSVTPHVLSVEDAVKLNDGLVSDPGVVVTALLPHLIGTFFGVLLLMVAAWRSGAFPTVPCALVVAFLVWDFLLPTWGLLEPHLLLFVGWTWLGVALLRLPHSRWVGAY